MSDFCSAPSTAGVSCPRGKSSSPRSAKWHLGQCQSFRGDRIQLLDDRLRRALWSEEAKPDRELETVESGLRGGWEGGGRRQAALGLDRISLDAASAQLR